MDIINVERRDMSIKAKQLRRTGKVPCSVYGGALPNAVSIQMDLQTANQLFREKREGSRVQLKLDGEVIPTQIKESTRNFDNHNVEHISFQALKADQPVNSVAHIQLINTDSVHGVLEHMLYEVPYSALPKDMIDYVTIDLDGKQIGTVITVADIPEFQSEAITLQIPEDSMVLRVVEAKSIVEEETDEDTDAAAEAPAEE